MGPVRRQTPGGQGHIGVGHLIHIETQAEVVLLLKGQQGDNSGKFGVWDLTCSV